MDKENYRPYTAKRWTEIPKPQLIGHTEFTEEQKRKNDKNAEDMLRQYGILKPENNMRDSKIVKE